MPENRDPFYGRCNCHHWGGWGDSGSMRMRTRCNNGADATRDSDGRHVCRFCVSCDPSDSEGF